MLSLILGVVLGALAVVFILQNVAVVTVTFLGWHFTGSLAITLLLTMLSGVFCTLLVMLPGLLQDVFHLSSVKRQKLALEDELAKSKRALDEASARAVDAQKAAQSKLPPLS